MCLCLRIYSLVLWEIGISGSAATCKTPPVRAHVEAGALPVGEFSHSCSNNDAFRDVQQQVIIADQE